MRILNFNIANLDASDEIKIDKLENTNNNVASPKSFTPKELAIHKFNPKEVNNLINCTEEVENKATV